MAINVSIQYNGGFLSDIVLLTQSMLLLIPSGNPHKYDEEVLSWQPMFPPKCFDKFSPCLGNVQKV